MSKSHVAWTLLVLAVAIGGLAWQQDWFGLPVSDDPAVADVQRLQRAINVPDPDLDAPERAEIQDKATQLTPAQIADLFTTQRQKMMAEEEARLRKFFAQSEAEQIRELDGLIDKLEAARRRAESDPEFQRRKALAKPVVRKPSQVTNKTRNDLTTPAYRALSQQHQQKLTARMEARGVRP